MPLERDDLDEVQRYLIGAVKAAAWEEAKGKLRALVALSGQNPASEEGTERYERIKGKVERFIRSFEEYGLDEP